MKQTAVVIRTCDQIVVHSIVVVDGVEYAVGGYGLPSKRMDLVPRLVRAIEAGKVFENISLKDGAPNQYRAEPFKYVSVEKMNVLGRTMNADLKRLGF